MANGPQISDRVYGDLCGLPNVQAVRLSLGSLSNALLEGRRLIETEFFGFLDDDDELLPDSSDWRLRELQKDSSIDIALVNGYREIGNRLEVAQRSLRDVEGSPLRTLLEFNWCASCAALFRTSTIGVEAFESPHPYAEWTWLAYRLSLAGRRFRVIDIPGYIIHDTPASLSKSSRYLESYIGLFDRMLAEDPPAWVKRRIVRKRCATLHDLSVQALSANEIDKALALHLSSMSSLAGMRYFLYGRKILIRSLMSSNKGSHSF